MGGAVGCRISGWLICSLLLALFVAYPAVETYGTVECTDIIGRLVSIQGKVHRLREGQTEWALVSSGEVFCAGDRLRVLSGGRAAVVLQNETIIRINQNSTVHFTGVENERLTVLRLLKGIVHIFSHRPRALKVITPYVNGTVEGTEFVAVSADERSVITVFEGKVAVLNEKGMLDVTSGQSIIAERGKAPRFETVVRPRDAVAWTLYYPAIIERSAEVSPASLRIAAMLDVGRVLEARELLASVLSENPFDSDALALSAIIEVAGNNREDALALALKAVEQGTGNHAAALALSYARQAFFDIEEALKVLENAERASPGNTEVRARLAELLLSVGELDAAVAMAGKAAAAAPGNGRAQSVLGFALLAQVETAAAKDVFAEAVRLDQASPMARLGLGLAMIRDGQLEQGRSQIEIAAALDPGNGLVRSYLGKAYFEEKRDFLAGRQYKVAREIDPFDPTPWFYDAIRKHLQNRPVEALRYLQKSIALNDNRAVYRSRFLLDADLAARSAGLGRIYTDLGFQQLALAEGWKSVSHNPADYSAHRFISDTYSIRPRHEVARVSELLQSQLLQPLNLTPVQPQLAESSIVGGGAWGAATVSYNEFTPLFLRNGMALQASGAVGSNDTAGEELVYSALWNRISWSLGQFYYQTDGIRENNDQQRQLYNGYIQRMLSPTDSLMAELRHMRKDYGDLSLLFDPMQYSSTIRQQERGTSFRIGGRHDFRPGSTLIGTAIVSSDESDATGIEEYGVTIDIGTEADSGMAEIQHLYSGQRVRLQTGGGYVSASFTDYVLMGFPADFRTEDEYRTQYAKMYGYAQVDILPDLVATVGLSGEDLQSEIKDRSGCNPKFGISWQPSEDTLVRGAAFRTLHGRTILSQTIEPTHVSGFNQFFDDFAAATAWTYGVGFDQKFSSRWYTGAQFFVRDLEVPFSIVDMNTMFTTVEDDWKEQAGTVYLYWAPFNQVAVGLEYYYEKYERDQWGGPEGIKEQTTHRLTPQLNYHHASGFSAGVRAHYIDQEGVFGYSPFFNEGSDRFWIVDLSLGYRLPERYGMLRFEIKNLFDEQFNYLDTDPAASRYVSEMQVMARLTVSL